MRKYLSYIIFAGVVLLVGGIAVTRSRAIKTLVDGMKSSDRQLQAASAGTLIKDEQFMDSISGDTTETRVKAAEALEVLGSKGAITQLFNLLKDQEKVVRERAILALKHVGATTPENVTTFADGLKDGDGNVRKGVLRAMSEGADAIGPKPGIIPAICIAMQKEGNARGPGGDILSSKVFLAAKSEIESIPLLVALLKDKDEGVRTGAAEAMGKMGTPIAVPALLDAMKTDTAQVRRVAIASLALIASPETEAPLAEALTNENDDNEARTQAASGLGKIGTPTAVTLLISHLNDDDLKIRSASVVALAHAAKPTSDSIINPAVLKVLLQALKSNDPLTRIGAVRAIQPLQTSLANNQIIAHLKSDDNDIRAACAIALGFAGNGGSVSSLIAALHDADGDIGTAAVDALASIGEPAIEPLVAVLKSNQDQALYAAEALAKIGMPSFEALKTLAGSASPVSQRWAAVALGEMGIAEGLPVLTTLSQSNNEEVAFVAKDQLARLGKVQ